MSVLDWVSGSVRAIRENGLHGVNDALYEFRVGVVRRLSGVRYDPERIWSRDWDLLVVLDACRLDLLASVEAEYDFLDRPGEFTSAASSTTGWLEVNFGGDGNGELGETAYVTGNPNSVRAFPYQFPDACECGTHLTAGYDDVYHAGTIECSACGRRVEGDRQVPVRQLDEVWRDHWNNELGTIPPRPVTEAAIHAGRTGGADQLVVHYMQPHHPFLSAPSLDSGSYIAADDSERRRRSRTVWEALRRGTVDHDTVWRAYRDNLRDALDDVELLLENVDAEHAVITSDHGNALGEYGVYGHPVETPLDCLTRVPWYRTTAVDERTYEPSTDTPGETLTSDNVEKRLADLGYR